MALFAKFPNDLTAEATFIGNWDTDVRYQPKDYVGLTEMPNFPDAGQTAWVVTAVGWRLSPFAEEAHMDVILEPENTRAEDALTFVRSSRSGGVDPEDDETRFIV